MTLTCKMWYFMDYIFFLFITHQKTTTHNDSGHAHITDFNIATRLLPDGLACSMSGTKPYMAPEVFMCALEEIGKKSSFIFLIEP